VAVALLVAVELPAPSDAPEAAGFSVPDPSVAPAAPAPSAAGVSAPLVVELTLERLESRASFLAQPDPLNTMAGAERARFIGPPQRSHAAGPGADIPCITSTT
jgi:hypothetical protein